MKTVKLFDGVVVIRGALSLPEQLNIIEIVRHKGGLKDTEDNWNFLGFRGRAFNALSDYPAQSEIFLRSCFTRFRDQVERVDPSIPITEVTHLLSLWYPDKKGMGWHSDGYGGNNGDRDIPVYVVDNRE